MVQQHVSVSDRGETYAIAQGSYTYDYPSGMLEMDTMLMNPGGVSEV